MIARYLLPLALGAVLAPAQSFEVASLKRAGPQPPGYNNFSTMRGGPGTSDPGRITYTNFTLKQALGEAYQLKSFQIFGPGWIENERYDITAKVPAGASKEQFRVMLQSLLVERFRLGIRKEAKEQPIYLLGVARNGPKLKDTTVEAAPPTAVEIDPKGVPIAGRGLGADGFPELLPGHRGMPMIMINGFFRARAVGQTMPDLANFLVMHVVHIVADKTGLSGAYDFKLEFTPAGVVRPAGGGPPTDAGWTEPPPGPPTLFDALQQQLGLKLESAKGPVDTITIEKGEKAPIEN